MNPQPQSSDAQQDDFFCWQCPLCRFRIWSGGVDSQATARLLRNSYPPEDVILLFSDAGGWEDPLTPAFVAAYSTKHHPVVTVESRISDMWESPGQAEAHGYDPAAKLTFQIMCQIKGRAPSRKAQFCTEKLKLVPQRRWCQQHLASEEYERYTGIRSEESAPRRNYQPREWDTYFDCYVNHPILDWPKQRCFDYVLEHGEEINPLYLMGFGRVGCAPCINSSKNDILLWLQRRPEMIAKVRALEKQTGKNLLCPLCSRHGDELH